METQRDRLLDIYRKTHGYIPLSTCIVDVSDNEVERYRVHGIAHIHLPDVHTKTDNNIIINMSSLRDITPPRSARFKFAHDDLFLIVSSGKQRTGRGYKEFDSGKTLEGLGVLLYFKVSPNREIPYEAVLKPLYR